jgi:hypothetical protein
MISLAIGWETFYALELLGFFLLVMGTLVYNEILILPFECLNKNTKEMINKRQGKISSFAVKGQNVDYMSSSPTAGYDNSRNMRNIESKMNERYDLIQGHNQLDDNHDMYINDTGNNSSTG